MPTGRSPVATGILVRRAISPICLKFSGGHDSSNHNGSYFFDSCGKPSGSRKCRLAMCANQNISAITNCFPDRATPRSAFSYSCIETSQGGVGRRRPTDCLKGSNLRPVKPSSTNCPASTPNRTATEVQVFVVLPSAS